LGILAAGGADGDTITVCWDGSGDYPSIQGGIDAAADEDEVVLCGGTYSGSGNRDLDFGGKAITVRSTEPDNPEVVAATIIDCQGTGANRRRGFKFHSAEGSDSVVAGLTITHGYGAVEQVGSHAWSVGGAVFCTGSSPTIANCIIQGNTSETRGGGIFCYAGGPTITHCRISGNVAGSFGGGLCFSSANNATLSNCLITGNFADSGGGLAWVASTGLTMRYCTISGNSASGDGGGASFRSDSTLSIDSTRFIGNSAGGWGGGVECSIGTTSFTNCSLNGNLAESGGGILFLSGQPTFSNCTISGNSASDYGGGIYCHWWSDPIASNCILWGDSAAAGSEIALGSGISVSSLAVGYSDVQGGQAAAYLEDGCTLIWGEGNLDADAAFAKGPSGTWTSNGAYDPATQQVVLTDSAASWQDGQLAGKALNPDTTQALQLVIVDNTGTAITVWADLSTVAAGYSWVGLGAGYQVYDYHLKADSPCIDAGDNSAVPGGVTTDLDGGPRFVDDPLVPDEGNGTPPIVDLGAYEFALAISADFDGDYDVDQEDFGHLQACLGAPGVPPSDPNCQDANLDGDDDVDQNDCRIFQAYMSGANVAASPDPAD